MGAHTATRYSAQTLAVLRHAQWNEERRVPPNVLRDRLAAAGFFAHPAALAFLTRFEGLSFIHPSRKYEDGKNTCHFSLDRVIGLVDVADIDDYGISVGTRLCPVGEINRGNSIVAIGEDGRVFSYFSPFIAWETRTVEEAIEHFLTERPPIAVRRYDGHPLTFEEHPLHTPLAHSVPAVSWAQPPETEVSHPLNNMRRLLAAGIAAVVGWKIFTTEKASAQAPSQDATPAPAASSLVKPRHVVCVLGKSSDQKLLLDAVATAIGDFAAGFSVDETYSQSEPDERMDRSFSVSYDRVESQAWSLADEGAVAAHQSVLYVLGPRMERQDTVRVSMAALQLVGRLIDAGAVAVKGESAGVAHGIARWKELALQGAQALQADDALAQQRIARLAFAKRPLSDRGYLESVGFHLVGLPEVYVPQSVGDERHAVALMDAMADDMARRGVAQAIGEGRGTLSLASTYEDDDFKFNPYGIVRLSR